MHRREISKVLLATATAAGGSACAPSAVVQSGSGPFHALTAAEIAAKVTPTNYAYAPSPYIDVCRYGADPTGKEDSTTAIQNAISVGTQFGGLVFLPPGIYTVSSTLTLRPNVTIWGAGCGDSSDMGSAISRCTVLRPTADFHAKSDIIRADPADFGSGAYCVGVSLSFFTIDLVNVTGTADLCAIRLNSVSDNPVFRDLRVWNMGPTHTALHIGVSRNSRALLSDGTIFENLVALASATDTYTGSMVILEDCNEITLRDGKILSRSVGSPQSSSTGIQVKCTNIGCQGITIDAVSVAGFNTGIAGTATGGGVGCRWVRILNGTFEGTRHAIHATGTDGLRSQFWTIMGNRFISALSGGSNITLDFANNCKVIADDFFTTTNVTCTANAAGNEIWAQLAGVRDSGANNTKFGHADNRDAMQFSAIQGQPLQTPTLLDGWVQYSGSNRSRVGYWKGPDGIVHLQGHVCGGSVGTAAFVLPADHRPGGTHLKEFAVVSNGAFGSITVDASTGNVTPQVGSNVYFSLDGIDFRAGD